MAVDIQYQATTVNQTSRLRSINMRKSLFHIPQAIAHWYAAWGAPRHETHNTISGSLQTPLGVKSKMITYDLGTT